MVNTMTSSRYWKDITENPDLDLPVVGGMGKASSMALGLGLLRSYYETMAYSFHPVKQNLQRPDPRMRALQTDMLDWGFETQSV